MSTKPYSRRKIVFSAATGVALVALAKAGPAGILAQDTDYPELTMIATEYDFEMEGTTNAGFNRVTMDNQGAEDHHAILFRINDDSSPEHFEAALMSGDIGELLGASTAYGGPNIGPGGSVSVVINLDPGMYMAVCIVPDQDGVPHVAHGMVAPLEVTDGVVSEEEPESSLDISMIEMSFVGLPESVDAGDHVWKVANDGAQLHEIALLQLADGLNVDDLLGLLTGEPTEAIGALQGPPFAMVGGTAPQSGGIVNYLEISLETGRHVAICFIPDPEHDMPHFLMGMIQQFEVV